MELTRRSCRQVRRIIGDPSQKNSCIRASTVALAGLEEDGDVAKVNMGGTIRHAIESLDLTVAGLITTRNLHADDIDTIISQPRLLVEAQNRPQPNDIRGILVVILRHEGSTRPHHALAALPVPRWGEKQASASGDNILVVDALQPEGIGTTTSRRLSQHLEEETQQGNRVTLMVIGSKE